jgi:L-lactate dehydrogenase (cytochrome)
MVWPRATEILARAAHQHQLPFVLSTVATASIETVAEITEGRAWYQLYPPKEDDLRDKLLDRVRAAGLPVLVILADTPTFAYRPGEIRNGLSIPPRMTARNIALRAPHAILRQRINVRRRNVLRPLTAQICAPLIIREQNEHIRLVSRDE